MRALENRVERLEGVAPKASPTRDYSMYTDEQIDAMAAVAESLTPDERSDLDVIRERLIQANGDLDRAALTGEQLEFAGAVRARVQTAIDQHTEGPTSWKP